ncbi:MAG: Crp/Fnr family transcriptional regulator, partial [Clostridia bacterium]|nr:Crp/Fnr family transcriptional regulator [Clostridia bacterium]
MKKYFSVLRKCPLFNQINDEELIAMLSCLGARVVSFDKKYTIFAEGNPAKYIGIMLSGSAQIVQV